MTQTDIVAMRREAAQRERCIVFHSDGISMDNYKMMFPKLPGTQTSVCTYSLMHQFNLARLYRTDVAQAWPPPDPDAVDDATEADGLQKYIDFCHANDYEAFWAMRWNDTHDAADYDDAVWKFNNNRFKQEHPELLVGTREDEQPHGRWSSVDYTHAAVRDQAFRIWEDVCTRYDIDGIKLDSFRHPTFFKSVAWGEPVKDDEVESMTALIRRAREMMDRVGAERGRPILLSVRAPDCVRYCRAIGLDIETWMAEGLIDIWIATGYFRLNEWESSVETAHRYGVQHWACLDESRMQGDLPACRHAAAGIEAELEFQQRKFKEPAPEHKSPVATTTRNIRQAYRARALRAWDAGTDAVMLFNFFWDSPDPRFELLNEIGNPEALRRLSKVYCPYFRGREGMQAGYWLKGGEDYSNVPQVFSPESPEKLDAGETKSLDLLVSEDVGRDATVALCIQVEDLNGAEDLSVSMNGRMLEGGDLSDVWLEFEIDAANVKKGMNRFEISLAHDHAPSPTLHDLQLWVCYDTAE